MTNGQRKLVERLRNRPLLGDCQEAATTIKQLAERCERLSACVLEYWHAKDWDAVGAADATAAKLLPADMKAALAAAETEVEP